MVIFLFEFASSKYICLSDEPEMCILVKTLESLSTNLMPLSPADVIVISVKVLLSICNRDNPIFPGFSFVRFVMLLVTISCIKLFSGTSTMGL